MTTQLKGETTIDVSEIVGKLDKLEKEVAELKKALDATLDTQVMVGQVEMKTLRSVVLK